MRVGFAPLWSAWMEHSNDFHFPFWLNFDPKSWQTVDFGLGKMGLTTKKHFGGIIWKLFSCWSQWHGYQLHISFIYTLFPCFSASLLVCTIVAQYALMHTVRSCMDYFNLSEVKCFLLLCLMSYCMSCGDHCTYWPNGGLHLTFLNCTTCPLSLCTQGYKQQKAFIITQGPLQSTCRDFWKMVYDRKCGAIVMLSKLNENGKVLHIVV